MMLNSEARKYAEQACETMMRKFEARELPPVNRFHYHQGVFLSGVYKTYELNQNPKYIDYIRAWLDAVIDKEGNFLYREATLVDDMQPGILLFPFLDEKLNPEADPRYKIALDRLIEEVPQMKRNALGGFWHKLHLPNEMWLDGLYMVGPLLSEYAARFNREDLFDDVAKQVKLMIEGCKDTQTGLLYHAFDPEKNADWADEKGQSPEFWGRSVGWVPVAILDDLDFMPKDYKNREALKKIVQDLLTAIYEYQSEEGRWYQVIDAMEDDRNWLENSCSCLFAAAMAKAIRQGIMPADYKKDVERAFYSVIESLHFENEDLLLGEVCIGTGVGDYEFYLARPCSTNDLHGMGAFLLMCTEVEKMEIACNEISI